jgi:hypothetical protein
MYLKCQLNRSTGRKPTLVFYALCLLYALSTATVVSDLVSIIVQLEVSNNSICKNIIFLINYAVWYGNPDCQASQGFAKHAAEGDADDCCCNQTFSR